MTAEQSQKDKQKLRLLSKNIESVKHKETTRTHVIDQCINHLTISCSILKRNEVRWNENCKGAINLKIHIEDNIYIESDEHQFMLKRYGKPYINKDGEKVDSYTFIGYYPTIEQAIDSLIKMKTLKSQATTLKELKEDVESIREFVKSKIDF